MALSSEFLGFELGKSRSVVNVKFGVLELCWPLHSGSELVSNAIRLWTFAWLIYWMGSELPRPSSSHPSVYTFNGGGFSRICHFYVHPCTQNMALFCFFVYMNGNLQLDYVEPFGRKVASRAVM